MEGDSGQSTCEKSAKNTDFLTQKRCWPRPHLTNKYGKLMWTKQVTYVTINAIGTSCISLIKSKLMRKKLNNPQLLLRQP